MNIAIIFSLFYSLFTPDNSFIKLEYTGPVDKPITQVILYVDQYKANTADFIDTFKISHQDFSAVKKLVEKDSSLIQKKEIFFYRITISKGTVQKYYYIKNKKNLASFFKQVSDTFASSNLKEKIKEELNSVLKRL